MVYIASFILKITIYIAQKAQIALFIIKKIIILTKYAYFANIFFEKSAIVMLKRIDINKYAINSVNGKQLSYWTIYNLDLVEFKILKTYTITNLVNTLIWPLKLSVCAPILFVYKPNGSFWLFIDYWDLNNLTIKNWYLLLLINKSLD